ncbi:MAG: AtpZ/AtpI family protein [Pseudomonadota bacterium]
MSLDDLKQRIAAAQQQADGEGANASNSGPAAGNLGHGLRIGIEFVSAIGVGTFMGWLFDQWMGTLPLGMIVMFFVGSAAGFMNVFRMVQRQEQLAAQAAQGDGASANEADQDTPNR